MDREKLNKAAEEQANYSTHWSWGDRKDCFISGADWLMQQPLQERLTDEEKEKIRTKYNELKSLNSITNEMFADDTAILEWIFGADLFKEK